MISITGRLTADAELQNSQNGNAFAHFDIADNHGKDKDGKDEVTFFRCTAFGKTAERVANTYKKGHLVSVGGQLKVRPYVDKNGQNRTSNDVNVNVAGFPMTSVPNDQPQPPAQYGAQPGYQQPPVGYPPQQGTYPPPAAPGYGAPQQPQQNYGQQPAVTGYPPQQQQYQQQPQYQQPPQPQQGNMFGGQPPMQPNQTAPQYQQPGAAPGQRAPF